MLSRRAFIVSGIAVGGGVAIAVGLRGLDDGDAALKFAAADPGSVPINAWIRIGTDGRVTFAIHRAEMGQGVVTTLAQLLAEELDADWNDLAWDFAPVDRDYYNFAIVGRGQPLGDPESGLLAATGTWVIREVFHALGLGLTISSSSTVDAWDMLRPAAAAARNLFVKAAAKRWNASTDGLLTRDSRVIHPDGRELSYADLAADAGRLKPDDDPALKAPEDFRFIGRNVPRLDVPGKVTGQAEFGFDIELPDMLVAAIAHSPLPETRAVTVNEVEVKKRPGVAGVVPAGSDAFAVVAGTTWQALSGAAALQIEASDPEGGPVETSKLYQDYRELLDSPDQVLFTDEEAPAPDVSLEAIYELPYLNHACLEPMNCTVRYEPGDVEVWAGTQAASLAADVVAEETRVDRDRIRVNTTYLGGGFGRRSEMDYVRQAARVAMAFPGRPVKLVWSREEDMRHDKLRPAVVARLGGALVDDGLSLDYTLTAQSVVASNFKRTPTPRGGDARKDKTVASGVLTTFYDVAAMRIAYTPVDSHIPVGPWRSVSNSYNGFILESFLDELAASEGMDPIDLRRQALPEDSLHRKVLDTAAERAGWGDPLPAGRGRGVALIESHDSVVAHIIEVTTRDGQLVSIDRVVSVIDCGRPVHPDTVIGQVEGSVTDGLSAALYERMDFAAGVPVQTNFDSYRRLRLKEMPAMDVYVMPSERRPGGVGEPAVPGVAPALTNAVFAAGGERIRTLPLAETHIERSSKLA